MSVWPVIVRELRAEARRPANYWLRVVGAGGVLGAVTVAMFDAADPSLVLFGYINLVILTGIGLFVPALAADCISCERREGTLGLLFLTPLSSFGIVAGKSVVHGLRALTLLFTMLPVMAVPFLAGGVGYKDLAMALSIDLGALILCLAAGILASTFSRGRIWAVILAETLGFVLLLAYLSWHVWNWAGIIYPLYPAMGYSKFQYWTNVSGWESGFGGAVSQLFSFGSNTLADDKPLWSFIWIQPVAIQWRWLGSGAMCALATLLVLFGAMMVASFSIHYSWKDKPQSARSRRVVDFFCRPRFRQKAFRQSLRRVLERNPIGWLHFYSWKVRMAKWGWTIAVLGLECVIGTSWQDIEAGQPLILLILAAGMALSASGSFRKDRETGALELLLVTPLRNRHLIGGRVLALWEQFGAAFAALLIVWWYMKEHTSLVLPALSTYLTLPLVGLYFSLHRFSLVATWLCTCICGLVLPWSFARSTLLDLVVPLPSSVMFEAFCVAQVFVATVAATALIFRLRTRRFVLGT